MKPKRYIGAYFWFSGE
jgi:hypothetical protein